MHSEYIRQVESADTAVLFIHGILGTPRHFDFMIPLVPLHYSIYNILLDGHGGGVRSFSRTSMIKWKKQVHDVLDGLSRKYKKVIIVAHSMGTLFSISESIERPNFISRMFFLASPMKLFIKPRLFINSAKVYFNRITPKDVVAEAGKKVYGITENDKCFWRYLGWTPRYFELFSEIRRVRKLLPSLNIPTIVIQSSKDEMVTKRAGRYYEELTSTHVLYLKNSSHFYYEDNDREILKKIFLEFIQSAF